MYFLTSHFVKFTATPPPPSCGMYAAAAFSAATAGSNPDISVCEPAKLRGSLIALSLRRGRDGKHCSRTHQSVPLQTLGPPGVSPKSTIPASGSAASATQIFVLRLRASVSKLTDSVGMQQSHREACVAPGFADASPQIATVSRRLDVPRAHSMARLAPP